MNSVRSKQVCDHLGVPATTLRLWSTTFEEFLSPGAQTSLTEKGTPAQRRYTEDDIALLAKVQELLGIGLTYDAIKESLANKATQPALVQLPAVVASSNGHSNGAVALPGPIDLSEVTELLARSVALYEATLEKQDQLLKVHEESLVKAERQEALLQQNVAVQQEILHELKRHEVAAPQATSLMERLKALLS